MIRRDGLENNAPNKDGNKLVQVTCVKSYTYKIVSIFVPSIVFKLSYPTSVDFIFI